MSDKKYIDGSMEFIPDEVKAGQMDKFISVLRELGCEMRIWTDGYCWIVDYLQAWRKEEGYEFITKEEMDEALDEALDEGSDVEEN